MYEAALFFHLVGAILFFAGLAVAAVGQAAARRRTRPSEVALLLRSARVGVAMVGAGTLLALVFGFWLVDLTGHGFDGWVLASLALLAFAAGIGAAGGQAPKRARRRAEELAREGDRPSSELQALLGDPRSAALNWAAAAAAVAILVLMVWKPGA
jgi:uncharacterized membrane protein